MLTLLSDQGTAGSHFLKPGAVDVGKEMDHAPCCARTDVTHMWRLPPYSGPGKAAASTAVRTGNHA